MRTTATLALAVVLLLAAGCGKQEERPADEAQSRNPQTVSVPEIDLHTAAATGDMEAIREYIAAGADLDVRDPEGGACPLSTAALFGRTEAALALIDAGADINCRGNDGATPLHVAAFFCRPEIVSALLEKGADTTVKNKYGSTPLETVTTPFETVEPVYEHFQQVLGPAGLKLDLGRIREMRPRIAEMLRAK
jgi:hypothetical protein